MEAKKLLEILSVAEQLKCRTRHCDTSSGRRESVAEHSWRVALMAMLMEDEFPDLDIDKVIRMCLIHDLGEAFTGDIPAFLKKSEDGEKEEAILERWVGDFPAPYNEEWLALEYELQLTYGRDKVAFSPYLQGLKAEIDDWTRRKIAESQREN